MSSLITKIEVLAIKLPLREPFVIAYEHWHEMPSILVRITTNNGLEGWGEAVPDPNVSSETPASCVAMLREDLAPQLIGADALNLAGVHQRMDFLRGAPAAKAAVDIACHDILAKHHQQPLYRLFGTSNTAELPAVIPIDSPENQAKTARAWLTQGFSQFKVKLGADPKEDSARITAVRAALGPDAHLRVDANQGWSRSDAQRVLPALIAANVEVLEQPLPWWDLEGLAELRESIPIMADEAVLDSHDLERALRLEAMDWLNIKLMKCGGLYPAKALAEQAQAAGVRVLLGSMLESAIGSLAGAHFAAAMPGVQANEMVGPQMFSRDCGPFPAQGKLIGLSAKSGLGFEPDMETISELTTSQVTIR
ncbi:MAG: dipeptide epimerase [Firmicutes bacterium]|nr:dipeptide epimerase [Bacillota bacterium]